MTVTESIYTLRAAKVADMAMVMIKHQQAEIERLRQCLNVISNGRSKTADELRRYAKDSLDRSRCMDIENNRSETENTVHDGQAEKNNG